MKRKSSTQGVGNIVCGQRKTKSRKEDFPYLLFLKKELDNVISECGYKLTDSSSSLVQWVQDDSNLGILDKQYPDWYDKLTDTNKEYFPDYLTFYENSNSTKENYTLEKMTAVFQSMGDKIIELLNGCGTTDSTVNAGSDYIKQLAFATRAVNFTRSYDKWYGFRFEPYHLSYERVKLTALVANGNCVM